MCLKRASVQQPLFMLSALSFVIPSVPGFPTSLNSPATTYVVLLKENHTQLTEAATLHRKSGEPSGSAVQRTCPGNAESCPHTELSSRPERSVSGEIRGLPNRQLILQFGVAGDQAGLGNNGSWATQRNHFIQDAARQSMLGHLGQFNRRLRREKSSCVAVGIEADSRTRDVVQDNCIGSLAQQLAATVLDEVFGFRGKADDQRTRPFGNHYFAQDVFRRLKLDGDRPT